MAELYCRPCDQDHSFTGGEVERIVYALTGEVETYATSEGNTGFFPDLLCLDEVLASSLSEDGYREHVDQAVEARRGFERQHGGRRG